MANDNLVAAPDGIMLPVRVLRLSGHHGAGRFAIVEPPDFDDVKSYTGFIEAARGNQTRGLYVATKKSGRTISLAHMITGYR
jgi:hypothetical protein